MTFDSPPCSLELNFDQLYLELLPLSAPLSQGFSTPGADRRALINQCCLEAFLPWLREEQGVIPQIWTRKESLPSFWELVNGTAIGVNTHRLVLIPTEAIDLSELRVPQEWVDIPTWAADYYLAVQIDLEAKWLRVMGYITHQDLKTISTYDAGDRTYSCPTTDLIPDLNVLWLAQKFCPDQPLRAETPPLPALPPAQAENLLVRLGNPQLVFPRLELPFQLWGSLLEHGGWRQRLWEKRQGLSEQWSVPNWLQENIATLAQQLGWAQIEVPPVPRLAGTRGAEVQFPTFGLSRPLVIADRPYELQVSSQSYSGDRIWRFELRSADPAGIPLGLTLRLLTEDLQPFEHNSDTATAEVKSLYVEVVLQPGERLVWETEPLPENYDREILSF